MVGVEGGGGVYSDGYIGGIWYRGIRGMVERDRGEKVGIAVLVRNPVIILVGIEGGKEERREEVGWEAGKREEEEVG